MYISCSRAGVTAFEASQIRRHVRFLRPSESVHDACVSGHASNSVSVALGMARARSLLNLDYSVIAVLGDGALTGGLAYEALNDADTLNRL